MLPDAYLERMATLLGDEFEQFLSSYRDAPSTGLRVNTLKIRPESFVEISPFPLTPIPWTLEGFTLASDYRPGTHPFHAAGLYYLQDPAAMAVTELLDPQPGDRILDLAAAPGGKTTHIASRMNHQGLLLANDINPGRVRDLHNNLERWGARNTVVLNETPQRLADYFGPFFDKVLLDAPCSGEGMFRKDPAARYEWNPRMVESCAIRQGQILAEAARLVRPGGRLVYATCTFAPEEDEGSVLRFLEAHPGFEIEEIESRDGFSSGRPDWLPGPGAAGSERQVESLRRTVRLWPHLSPGEGHYIAVFRKKAAFSSHYAVPAPFRRTPLIGETRRQLEAFSAETLRRDFSADCLSLQGKYLYRIPAGMPDLHGLRVIHWGWWLGEFKVRRFEPSQALVMALVPEDLCQVCSFEPGDSRLSSFLRGEVLTEPGADGWVMVAVAGFPLGWAKRVQNRLKPRFPRWLRLDAER